MRKEREVPEEMLHEAAQSTRVAPAQEGTHTSITFQQVTQTESKARAYRGPLSFPPSRCTAAEVLPHLLSFHKSLLLLQVDVVYREALFRTGLEHDGAVRSANHAALPPRHLRREAVSRGQRPARCKAMLNGSQGRRGNPLPAGASFAGPFPCHPVPPK